MNEAELILTSILNCSRTELYLKKFFLDEEKLFQFNLIQKKRREGYPLAYLLGEIEFFGLNFKIKEGVFIPRQETEILVATVINIVKLLNCHTVKLLDIGTGCGCIAISLAKFLPKTEITAIDISKEAIEIARKNAELNNVEINFIQSNLFSTHNLTPNTYDLIVSNPPYIPAGEIESLPPEVRYEPRTALDGGKDGLSFYKKIIHIAPRFLKKEGFLIMEIGFGQSEKIRKLFKDSNFRILDIVRDYSNIERVIVAQLE